MAQVNTSTGAALVDALTRAAPRSLASMAPTTPQVAVTQPTTRGVPVSAPGRMAPVSTPNARVAGGDITAPLVNPAAPGTSFGVVSNAQAPKRGLVGQAMNTAAQTAQPTAQDISRPASAAAAPAPVMSPLFPDSAYTVAPTPISGDPNAWLQSMGLPTDRGIPNQVTFNGTTGYLIRRDPTTGRGYFATPQEAFTGPRNALDQGLYDELRREAGGTNFFDPARNGVKKQVNEWLDAHPAGQVIAPEDANTFNDLLMKLDPKGDAATSFRQNVGAGVGFKGPNYNIYTQDQLPSVLGNLGLEDFGTKYPGLLTQQQTDAGGGTTTKPSDLSNFDYASLIKELTSSEQNMLMTMGLGGILGGGYRDNSGMDPSFISAMLGSIGQSSAAPNVFAPVPLSQQPGLTSIPLL